MRITSCCIAIVSVLVVSGPVTLRASAQAAPEIMHWVVKVQEPSVRPEVSDRPIPIALRPVMLALNIEELAGQSVKILNARVVEVLEPQALLIESANHYRGRFARRDRILVLIEAAKLRVPDESIVSSTINVVGVARTLLGAQVSREVPWPTKLDRNLLRRLDVRAAVVATSVRTAEGTELTDRRPISQGTI